EGRRWTWGERLRGGPPSDRPSHSPPAHSSIRVQKTMRQHAFASSALRLPIGSEDGSDETEQRGYRQDGESAQRGRVPCEIAEWAVRQPKRPGEESDRRGAHFPNRPLVGFRRQGLVGRTKLGRVHEPDGDRRETQGYGQ